MVNRALCANPQTRAAWATARAQAARWGMSRSAYLPTLSITGTVSRSHSTSSISGFQAPIQNQFNPGLSLNYLLFDFGARSAAVASARDSLLAADWTQNATLQGVMLNALQAYYQTFATRQAAQATVTSEKSAYAAYQAARYRRQIGASALADVLQARTAWSQAQLNRQKAEGQAKIAQGNLANALGLEADTPITLAPPAVSAPNATQTRNVRTLIAAAKAARPDLAAAKAQVNAAQQNLRRARTAGLPTFNLFANTAYTHSSVFPNSRNWSLGVSFSLPLFTGYNDTYKVHVAQAQLESRQAQREKLTQQVALDVWTAYQHLQTARDTYRSSADVLASATEAEKVALGSYKAGANTMLNLLSAQASLANARRQRIQAQYDWYTSRAALAQAVGRLRPGSDDTANAGQP